MSRLRRVRRQQRPDSEVFADRWPRTCFVTGVFALGNSSDAFLILRAQDLQVATVMIPVLYLVFNLVYSSLSIPAGLLADRIGRRKVALLGFAVFAAAYAWMATAESQAAAWGVFMVYGIYMAIADGNGRALLAEFSTEQRRGTRLRRLPHGIGAGGSAGQRHRGTAVRPSVTVGTVLGGSGRRGLGGGAHARLRAGAARWGPSGGVIGVEARPAGQHGAARCRRNSEDQQADVVCRLILDILCECGVSRFARTWSAAFFRDVAARIRFV